MARWARLTLAVCCICIAAAEALSPAFETLEWVSKFGANSLEVEAFDGVFFLPENDLVVSTHLAYYGQYERPAVRMVIEILSNPKWVHPKKGKKMVILDIGANVGAWTVPLARFAGGQGGRVLAFEPQYDVMLHLSATLLRNSIKNVYPYQAVVTNISGYTRLYHAPDQTEQNFGGFSVSGLGQRQSSNSVFYSVPNVLLDELYFDAEAFDCPQFIKMDVELHELYALLGAQDMLRECRPVLFLEANCRPLLRSLVALLDHLGYGVAWMYAPLVDPPPHQLHGVAYSAPEYPFDSDHWQDAVFGGPNVLAVPTPTAAEVFASLPGELFPIDYASGKVDVEDYKIKYCLGREEEGMCSFFRMHDDHGGSGNTCGGIDIPLFAREYWRALLPAPPFRAAPSRRSGDSDSSRYRRKKRKVRKKGKGEGEM
jgi:FkbM family methyltransferase